MQIILRVDGYLEWRLPHIIPDVTDTSGNWVFIPIDDAYDVVEGSIDITVNKATPEITVIPTVDERIYNPNVTLKDCILKGGLTDVDGIWTWEDMDIVPTVDNVGYVAVFIPEDDIRYNSVTTEVTVTVNKATPIITDKPTAGGIVVGSGLVDSLLSSGRVCYSDTDDTDISGKFVWEDSSIIPALEDSEGTEYMVIWIPDDSVNYNGLDTYVTVPVKEMTNAPGQPEDIINVPYEVTQVSQIELQDNWMWSSEDASKELKVGQVIYATAEYIGSDADRYIYVFVEVAITRQDCKHEKTDSKTSDVYATCEGRGSHTETLYCLVCGRDLKKTTMTLPALGHNWDDWVQTKAPTYTEEGEETRICKNDHSHIEVRKIARLTQPVSGDTNTGITEVTEKTTESKVTEISLKTGTKFSDNLSGVTYVVISDDVNNLQVEYSQYSGRSNKTMVIPEKISYNGITYKVTSIAEGAFKNNKKVTSITIPSSIKSIGKNAFKGCKKLKTIIIKTKSLTAKTVKNSAFKGITKSTTIKVPKTRKKAYTTLFRKKGLSKKVKIKKI